MPRSRISHFLFLLLFLIALSSLASAVSVTIRNSIREAENPQVCNNLPPGICCRAFPVRFTAYNNPFSPGSATFTSLLPTDIAAVWARRGDMGGCYGVPIETHAGSKNWYYEGTGDRLAVGASYVSLNVKLPPDERETGWLTAEGMLGLVWGGGQWFAKGASSLAGVVGGGSKGVKRRMIKGVVDEEVGRAYMRGPTLWRWPDEVVMNGSTYKAVENKEMVYRNAEGMVLNMTGS
ncbi:MAG: hypothetical protein Q9220_004343 [cf. Caloplaca sp. 1 TL-2023]